MEAKARDALSFLSRDPRRTPSAALCEADDLVRTDAPDSKSTTIGIGQLKDL